MENEKKDSKYIFLSPFLRNTKLEKKMWFRFLKVLHGILAILIFLLICFIGYWYITDTTITKEVLTCKDGFNVDLTKNNWGRYDSDVRCGVCNFRISNTKQFRRCTPNERLMQNLDQGEITETKTKLTRSLWYSIPVVFGYLIIALVVLKLFFYLIIYIIAGKTEVGADEELIKLKQLKKTS